MKKILETERLILREMNLDDIQHLKRTLQDDIAMKAYEHAFSDEEVQTWLMRQIERYQQDGFGLWAVLLKEDHRFIGQCGLTMQPIGQQEVVEIGYLFERNYWHHGYATEAATACKEYAFTKLKVQEVYSIIRDNNLASQRVALRNGMKKRGQIIKHYYGMKMPHFIYSIKK